MTRKPRLPFGVTRPPSTCNTKASLITLDDHLGKSELMAWTWWSGEGFTLEVQNDREPPRHVDITWTQWDALKMIVRDLLKKDAT